MENRALAIPGLDLGQPVGHEVEGFGPADLAEPSRASGPVPHERFYEPVGGIEHVGQQAAFGTAGQVRAAQRVVRDRNDTPILDVGQ
jgi:hypothetical protein